jgi:hypothetical protein
MHALNEFDGQACPRLAPGGVGEILLGQMPHRGTGDVAVGDLLNEKPQGISRREGGVAELNIAGTRELIYERRLEKIIRAITNAGKGEIERSHPWPPVEKVMSLNNIIIAEGHGWRERS